MIQNVLPVVVGELNDFFKSHFDSNEDKVLLSNIIDQAGGVEIEDKNKIIVSLINIEEETTLKANKGSSSLIRTAAPVNINLSIMFSAYFNAKNYPEALKFISAVIYFFQSKQSFTPQNTPGLTSSLEKITFQLMNMTFHDMSMVFSMMGCKYMPSVAYKMRMLPFTNDDMVDEIPAISGIGLDDYLD